MTGGHQAAEAGQQHVRVDRLVSRHHVGPSLTWVKGSRLWRLAREVLARSSGINANMAVATTKNARDHKVLIDATSQRDNWRHGRDLLGRMYRKRRAKGLFTAPIFNTSKSAQWKAQGSCKAALKRPSADCRPPTASCNDAARPRPKGGMLT